MPLAVNLTILNPAVVFAETVEVISPSEFDEPAPFPFQFHDAKLNDAFTSPKFPTENPSALKAVTPPELVCSAAFRFEDIYFDDTLTLL